jgi:limonene-1,2-epoxide hydrolase
MIKLHAAAESYKLFFERLSRAQLGLMNQVFADNILFEDPFQKVEGIHDVRAVFDHMYQTLREPKFKVIDMAFGANNKVYMKWMFTARRENNDQIEFEGLSEVIFNDDGKAIYHKDFWDSSSAVYEKIPLLGSVLKMIKQKITNQ